MEIWLLERAEPLYKIYPWKALLRAGSGGCAETEYGQNLMQKMMMSYDSDPKEYARLAGFGEVLNVVVSDAQIENVAARKCLTLIAVVDVLRSAEDVADCIARKGLRLDTVVKRLDILHNHQIGRAHV